MITFTPIASSSSGNCYLLTSGEHRLLIDAGIPIARIRKALDYKLSSVDGCLVGHEHKDHCRSIPDLMKFGVDCYAMIDVFKSTPINPRKAHMIDPEAFFTVADYWTVKPFGLQHDVPNIGFLVADIHGDKMVYINDSYYCRYVFNGVNLFAIGCNYSPETMAEDIRPEMKRRLLTAHMSLSNCIKMLKANDLSKTRSIFLLHLSSANSDEEYFKNEVEKATGIPVWVAPK